jgi:hypothetical protein
VLAFTRPLVINWTRNKPYAFSSAFPVEEAAVSPPPRLSDSQVDGKQQDSAGFDICAQDRAPRRIKCRSSYNITTNASHLPSTRGTSNYPSFRCMPHTQRKDGQGLVESTHCVSVSHFQASFRTTTTPRSAPFSPLQPALCISHPNSIHFPEAE